MIMKLLKNRANKQQPNLKKNKDKEVKTKQNRKQPSAKANCKTTGRFEKQTG